MKMKISNYLGIVVGLALVITSMFFMEENFFTLMIGGGIIIIVTPFVIGYIIEVKIAAEKEEMFMEFTRNLVESVKMGASISKSILNVKNKPYGVLSKHINKLANQIHMGIPLNIALKTFSNDVDNRTISKALTLIGQAEKSGGDIGEILESVAGAVSTADKLKKEQKSSISSLVSQGYIIFVVFLIIVLVMQFKILPMVSGIATTGSMGDLGIGVGGGEVDQGEIANAFFYLLLIQGQFQ